MNIQSAYDSWSVTYDQDRNLTRDLDQITMRNAFANQRFKNTLELGCGTGKNTLLLAEISEAVHALDFSEGMIEQARQKLNAKNVEFARADLTKSWPSKNDSHDLIVCNLVLEHIEGLSHIFKEAFRSLQKGGRFFISELHPFRQYQGGRARFQQDGLVTEVQAYIHHVSEFLQAAAANNLVLESFNEYWHSEDEGKPPRLAVFSFKKE
ncbi:MAG: class I SAM-dependent methyltransferase [Arenimonas sp.]